MSTIIPPEIGKKKKEYEKPLDVRDVSNSILLHHSVISHFLFFTKSIFVLRMFHFIFLHMFYTPFFYIYFFLCKGKNKFLSDYEIELFPVNETKIWEIYFYFYFQKCILRV